MFPGLATGDISSAVVPIQGKGFGHYARRNRGEATGTRSVPEFPSVIVIDELSIILITLKSNACTKPARRYFPVELIV
jgi:hypothetical protein